LSLKKLLLKRATPENQRYRSRISWLPTKKQAIMEKHERSITIIEYGGARQRNAPRKNTPANIVKTDIRINCFR
jgi:transposase